MHPGHQSSTVLVSNSFFEVMSNYEDLLDDSEDDALLAEAADAAERQYRQQTALGGDPPARQTMQFTFHADHIVRHRRQRQTGDCRTDECLEIEEGFNLAITPPASERGQLFFLVLLFCIVIICCLVLIYQGSKPYVVR